MSIASGILPVSRMLRGMSSADIGEIRAYYQLLEEQADKDRLAADAGDISKHAELRAGLKGRR